MQTGGGNLKQLMCEQTENMMLLSRYSNDENTTLVSHQTSLVASEKLMV
jgi:hypothetical protein